MRFLVKIITKTATPSVYNIRTWKSMSEARKHNGQTHEFYTGPNPILLLTSGITLDKVTFLYLHFFLGKMKTEQ